MLPGILVVIFVHDFVLRMFDLRGRWSALKKLYETVKQI